MESTFRRVTQATTAIAAHDAQFPFQAQQLLRMTTGACEVDCLLQSLSPSAIVDELSEHTSTQMRKALPVIIKASPTIESGSQQRCHCGWVVFPSATPKSSPAAHGDSANRTLCHMLQLWKAGRIDKLWQRVNEHHKNVSPSAKQQEQKEIEREARRVTNLVGKGMLSRAGSQLCSRGLAPHTDDTKIQLQNLFPISHILLGDVLHDAPSFTVLLETVRKLILETPKWLAPGCSGLRAKHLKSLLCDRNVGHAAQALALLEPFVYQSMNGYLPADLQPHLCGGRLIPIIKKDAGVRPLVVGEVLRALVYKAALKEVSHQPAQLQTHQIGVGRKGPVILAAVQTVRSWVRALQPGKVILEIVIKNACNSIERTACMRGVAKYCPNLLRWAYWCLNGTSGVYWDATRINCSTSG